MCVIPILIPSYEPDNRLLLLLEELIKANITPVYIVNDGSDKHYDEIFNQALSIVGMHGKILNHDKNCGKGRALKTGFQSILTDIPEATGVITADSDGQHTVEDIKRIRDAMSADKDAFILGVRKFTGDGVPWKSRVGNELTRKVFRYASGTDVSDTQTGLRGIPRTFMKELLDVKGERFEFEMRMLITASKSKKITEIPIETVYDSANHHQTHFNTVRDSIRIYRILGEEFFKFLFSSLSSAVIDLILFSLFCALLEGFYPIIYAGIATALARMISATYNYLLNYKVVFKSSKSMGKSLCKYILLAVLQMGCSALLVTLAVWIFAEVPEVLLKVIVDIVLFFISYKIQQKFVF